MLAAPLAQFGLEEFMVGLLPGANPESVPLWADAIDVVFDGAAITPTQSTRTITSSSGLFDSQGGNFDAVAGLFEAATTPVSLVTVSADEVTGIHQQIQSDGTRLIVWGTDTNLYFFNDATVVTATRAAGVYTGNLVSRDVYWSFAQWGDWVIATNGVDVPQVLKGPVAVNFVAVANFPCTSAEVVRTLGPHAVFFNTTGTYAPTATPAAGNQIVWSKRDDIEAYDPSVAGNETAGELTVRDAMGGFTAVEQLGLNLIAYTEHGAHVISLDPTFLIGSQRGAVGLRVGSKNAVAVYSDLHYTISEAGIFATDGLVIVPVGHPKLGDWLKRNIDWGARSRIAAMSNMRQVSIKWVLPQTSGLVVLSLHALNQTLSFESRQFMVSARGMGRFAVVVGTSIGGIFELSPSSAGTTPELTTKPLAFSGRDAYSFLDLLVFRHEAASGTVQWRYGNTQSSCENAGWTTLGSFASNETELVMMHETVYVQFRLLLSTGVDWRLSGMDVIGKKAGRRY